MEKLLEISDLMEDLKENIPTPFFWAKDGVECFDYLKGNYTTNEIIDIAAELQAENENEIESTLKYYKNFDYDFGYESIIKDVIEATEKFIGDDKKFRLNDETYEEVVKNMVIKREREKLLNYGCNNDELTKNIFKYSALYCMKLNGEEKISIEEWNEYQKEISNENYKDLLLTFRQIEWNKLREDVKAYSNLEEHEKQQLKYERQQLIPPKLFSKHDESHIEPQKKSRGR